MKLFGFTLRNRKCKNEPPGLTGGALGSWRYNKIMQENRLKDKTRRQEKKLEEKWERKMERREMEMEIEKEIEKEKNKERERG